MSSALDSVFSQSVSALHESGHGRAFRVVAANNAGKIFTGTLQTEAVIDPDMFQGADPRERCFLTVPNSVDYLMSQMLLDEGRIELGLFVREGQRWKVVTADKNPGDVENKYEVVKVTAADK